ncbi:MAG: J domain-containing protein [Parachlamydiaceae bacterium]
MKISEAFEQMDISNALNFLLKNPAEIAFGSFGVGRPRVFWRNSGYEGSLSCIELEAYIFSVYCKAIRRPFLDDRSVEIGRETVSLGKRLVRQLKIIREQVEIKAAASFRVTLLAHQFFSVYDILYSHQLSPLFKLEAQLFLDETTYPCESTEFDPYKELGVTRYASIEEIKKQHRQLVLKHHPDRNLNDPKAIEKFRCIQKAYETLTATL